jgi:hypothetical protein
LVFGDLSGFANSWATRIVNPEAVAAAIVEALHSGRDEVFVPRELGPIARLVAGTPPRFADRIKRLLKADAVMTRADMTDRLRWIGQPVISPGH